LISARYQTPQRVLPVQLVFMAANGGLLMIPLDTECRAVVCELQREGFKRTTGCAITTNDEPLNHRTDAQGFAVNGAV